MNSTGLPSAFFACNNPLADREQVPNSGEGGVDDAQFVNSLLRLIRESEWNQTRPDALDLGLSILENATVAATTAPFETWTRTNDELRLEGTASLGAIAYSTPIPVNEYLQVRLSGEIVLQNTGVFVVTTTSADLARVLLETVRDMDVNEVLEEPEPGPLPPPPSTGEDSSLPPPVPYRRAFNLIDLLLLPLNGAGGADLRVEALGLPVGLESTLFVNPDPKGPEMVNFQQLGVVRPDGYYNYSRTHEFNTKAASFPWGPSELYSIFIYYPLAAANGPDATLAQKMLIKNWTIQQIAYIGLGLDKEGPPGTGTAFPARYEPRVEDWNALYALPDIKPGWGLEAVVHVHDQIYAINETHLIAPVDVRKFDTRCVDTVAPGYPTTRHWTEARGLSAPAEMMHSASMSPCQSDAIHGLRPHHVLAQEKSRWTTDIPVKSFNDAMNYVINANVNNKIATGVEDMTQRWSWSRGGLALNVLEDEPFAASGKPSAALEPLIRAVAEIRARAFEALYGTTGVLAKDPILWVDIERAQPYTATSFAPNSTPSPWQTTPPLHNWLLLNHSTLRTLGATGNTVISIEETIEAAHAGEAWKASKEALDAQRLPLRKSLAYHTLVEAAELQVQSEQGGANGFAEMATIRYAQLSGHGISGTGIAYSLTTQAKITIVDTNMTHFTRGLRVAPGAGIDVELYQLGGNLSVGDCSRIPVYHYASGHFRCTGYNASLRVRLSASATVPVSVCYQGALDVSALRSTKPRFERQALPTTRCGRRARSRTRCHER